MSRILSFAWTTPAFVTGYKTVTRRNWKGRYADTFKSGEILQAWNKSPRCGDDAFRVGDIVLTEDVLLQRTADAPEADFAGEGFAFLQKIGHTLALDGGPHLTPADLWLQWKDDPHGMLYVVRFQVLGLTPRGQELREKYEAEAAAADAQPKLPFGAIAAPERRT